ncbi:MAG: hypothetical protein B0W54_04640 [Cellvibrio sp. 79]|nr:MAG: hypothetical protein B0W54_04640 [Cellvibrio sp. 79]
MLIKFSSSLSSVICSGRSCCAGLGLFLGALLLSGCDKKDDGPTIKDSPTLAVVNGEAITAADVDFMLERMLQGQASVQVDEALRKKILDSLIASRAMKQLVKSQMPADAIERITQTVQVYEEELFVNAYLQQFAVPEPVTGEMVQKYYADHSAEFGMASTREFEILRAPAVADEKARDRLLAAVPEITATTQWQARAKDWQKNYNLQYQQGRSQAGLLHKDLDQAINRLEQGQTSGIIYVDSELYLVRVTKIGEAVVRPLAEVSADIRKHLAAQVLRDAVKKASDEARAKAKIEIPAQK